MRFRAIPLFLALIAFAACGGDGGSGGDDTKAAAAASSNANCVPGTWSMTESGVVRKFEFKEDGTGTEIYDPENVRPLTWEATAPGNVHIVYTAGENRPSTEWDLSVDCEKNVLSFGGARYSK